MNPLLLVHGYSAESKSADPRAMTGIYGSLPRALRERYGAGRVFDLDVSRYVSLEDGVRLDDVSRAMDEALEDAFGTGGRKRFDIVIHSTGALVVRNWLRRHSPRPSPLDRLVYLAGAAFGSGWAHIGKGQLARWGRYVFEAGAERGVQILDSLELGAGEALDLHLHFLESGNDLRRDYGVREFCLTGTQARKSWLRFPVRYSHEDGSDGVVRVASCNVNFNYLRILPKKRSHDVAWEVLARQSASLRQAPEEAGDGTDRYYRVAESFLADEALDPPVPLGILFECAHSGEDMGIVRGARPRQELLALLDAVLAADSDAGYRRAAAVFDEQTKRAYARAATELEPGWLSGLFHEPRRQYDGHAQLIFRLRDQYGRPVEHFDIYLLSGTSEQVRWSRQRPASGSLQALFEHTHRNSRTDGILVFYLRVTTFDEANGTWIDRLADVDGVDLEILPTEPQTDDIGYLPCRLVISGDRLRRFIRPHQTTIIDVELPRRPAETVFTIVEAKA